MSTHNIFVEKKEKNIFLIPLLSVAMKSRKELAECRPYNGQCNCNFFRGHLTVDLSSYPFCRPTIEIMY